MICRLGRILGYELIVLFLVVQPVLAAPQHAEHPRPTSKRPASPPAPPPATPAPPPDTRPYDPQLMRLSEILGTLSYLGKLCGRPDADQWRARMQALLDAEGSPAERKDRLAGAYNRGISGYGLSYRTCTPAAHLVIERFLREGTSLAKEVENRYRAS